MYRLLVLCILLGSFPTYDAASGSVELDEISFEKLIKKFDAALIKFDVAFPYGDKHEAFLAIAKDSRDVDELLVGEVGVKDYGEKDNEALALRFGVKKDDYPVVKLFIKGKAPITFQGTKAFTSDEIRRFVREHTGLYLSMPGCDRELDALARQFMSSNEVQRKKIIDTFDDALNEKNVQSGKIYKMIMNKVMDKGDNFPTLEYERMKKLVSGKLSEEKKKELGVKQNILQAYLVLKEKEEL